MMTWIRNLNSPSYARLVRLKFRYHVTAHLHIQKVMWEILVNLVFVVCSQGREMEIRVGTDIRDGNGTTRVINWCGCYVQDPHPAVRALGFLPKEGHGVYVTR